MSCGLLRPHGRLAPTAITTGTGWRRRVTDTVTSPNGTPTGA